MTLYSLMDYLHAGWAEDDIRAWLNLTNEQLRAAADYIAAHRDEVEAEYAEVVQQAKAQRQHWETRLSEHLARTPCAPVTPEKAKLYAKLAEQRRKTIQDLLHADTSSREEPAASPNSRALAGLLATDQPLPTDEDVARWLDERRMEKYGR